MAFARLGDNQRAWELFTMINPVNHAKSRRAVATIRWSRTWWRPMSYLLSPHTGRGGWTWYTGSAGWMYRLITESLLGLHLEVDKLHFDPCLPAGWGGFKMHYRYRETVYHIHIVQAAGGSGAAAMTIGRGSAGGRRDSPGGRPARSHRGAEAGALLRSVAFQAAMPVFVPAFFEELVPTFFGGGYGAPLRFRQ